MYYSTKHYDHSIGLSAVFRQPNAAFKFTFGCKDLDNKNWAVDFGGLKPLKSWLEDNFDHKLVVDRADPHLADLLELQKKGLAEIRVMTGVGAEKFAEHSFNFADRLVREMTDDRCFCVKSEVAEHGSNSAIYEA
mgnify:CR=1 FL=1